MTGFILLFTVACLGGVIATVGDRIGMKVGKARLSLFNLRPRQTATVISVATGMVASFSTLLLMIALDGQLRRGLFDLDEIQEDLAIAQSDLEETRAERDEVEQTLEEATEQQAEARSRLLEINESLQTAIAREEDTLDRLLATESQLGSVSEQAVALRGEINDLRNERQALVNEQAQVLEQIALRDQEIDQRNQEIQQRNRQLAERSEQLAETNAEIGERDRRIAQRDQEIAEREARLEELQTQQAFLSEEIRNLETEFQGLRQGNVAIGRNQTLALTLTRTNSEEAARRAVDDALAQANRLVAQAILPGIDAVDSVAIRVDPDTVQQVVSAITDQQNYVIRVSSSANYIVGEPCVNDALTQGGEPCLDINLDYAINEVRYQPGETLARTNVSRNVGTEALIEKFTLLRATAEFQARRNGIIRYQPIIAGGRSDIVLGFLSQVQTANIPLEIQAIISQPVLTTGPVYVDLAAVQDGEVLFRTRSDN